MEPFSVSLTPLTVYTYYSKKFPVESQLTLLKLLPSESNSTSFPTLLKHKRGLNVSTPFLTSSSRMATATSTSFPLTDSTIAGRNHWMVVMDLLPEGIDSKAAIVNYYVRTLERVLGSEKDAQMCIYDASCVSPFGFCCEIDEEASRELGRLPGVLSVRPDPDYYSGNKDYSFSAIESNDTLNVETVNLPLFPAAGKTRHWLVRMDKPAIGVVTKAQMVDYYVQILTKVLGNEKDAQMCIYHVSWQSKFGFCCELDDECAQELAGVPGVLSVELDKNLEAVNNDNEGNQLEDSTNLMEPSEVTESASIKTKKLFITGLSFYTSEKTLRAAFEGFGELVEVKIIMDKISKRSKGYAFVEYTTEEAASAALEEMNGKIINGWMIVVDVAKSKPPRSIKDRPRQTIR